MTRPTAMDVGRRGLTDRRIAVVTLGLLATCSPSSPSAADPAEPAAVKQFRHRRSRLVARLGSPRHTAADIIVNRAGAAVVSGKFAYSDASKDLEDEYVVVEVRDDKKKWTRVGRALTDNDGRASFEVPARLSARAGSLRYRMTVEGDGSGADGNIWVMATGASIAIFDIDGTLTPADSAIMKRVVWGSDVKVRPGALDVVGHWSGKRALPIYLTGRAYLFNEDTRRWLASNGFPAGPLITPARLRSALPTSSGVGAFKKAEIEKLIVNHKLAVKAAYGNATTDVCAFAQAGIDPLATFIIDDDVAACDGFARPHAISDFRKHLERLRSSP